MFEELLREQEELEEDCDIEYDDYYEVDYGYDYY